MRYDRTVRLDTDFATREAGVLAQVRQAHGERFTGCLSAGGRRGGPG